MHIHYSIDICATPQVVFCWVADPNKAMAWSTSVQGSEIIHQTDGWVGTTFREVVADEGGSAALTGVITEYVQDRSIGFHLEGKYNRADVRYELTAMAGKTRLSQSGEVTFKGISRFIMFFIGPLFRSKIRRQAMGEFTKLKALCEQTAAQASRS